MSYIGADKVRILVADDETLLSVRLTDFLCSKGFDARNVTSGVEVRKLMNAWRPQFVLYDLMLPELNAMTFLRDKSLNDGSVKVFVMSGHNDPTNIRDCMRLGAADYIPKPIAHEALLSRLVLHVQQKREVKEFRTPNEGDRDGATFFMHLTDLVLREALKPNSVEDTLHNLTGLMSVSLKSVRTSIIKCDRENRKGHVIASSDKRNIGPLVVDLVKYPEITYVLSSEKTLAIDNLESDPRLSFVAKLTKSITFNAMIVAPIRINNEIWGIVSARLPEARAQATEFEIRWAQIVAHVAALVALRNPELAKSFPFAGAPVTSGGTSSGTPGGSTPAGTSSAA